MYDAQMATVLIFLILIRNDTPKSVKFKEKTEKPLQTARLQGFFHFILRGHPMRSATMVFKDLSILNTSKISFVSVE
jgi:hypothetical protein